VADFHPDLARIASFLPRRPVTPRTLSVDLFHDEDIAYAEPLRAAGVPCDVEVVPGAFHGFNDVAAKSDVSREFSDSQVTWLGRALTQRQRTGA
jgi:acetyl esterase/lipase